MHSDTDPTPAAISPAFRDALDVEDWDEIESLWLEALDASPVPCAELLEVRRLVWKAGRKNTARTLLELLSETLESRSDHGSALAALRELTRLTEKRSPELIARLERAFIDARADSPSLQRVVERYQLQASRRPLDDLTSMESWLDHDQGTVVEVIGQGVGRVVDINLELDNVIVDIGGTRPVSVPFGAVARFIRRLPEGDFLRRKVEETDALERFVKESPGDALVHLLESLGEAADVATIKVALAGLLPMTQWTSWWTKARKHPRILTAGSGSRLKYSVSASGKTATDALFAELQAAEPREALTIARRLAGRGLEEAATASQALSESLEALRASDPGLAWEMAAFVASLPGGEGPGDASRSRLVAECKPLQLLSGIRDRAVRIDALERLRSSREEGWVDIWGEWFLHEDHPANLTVIADQLVSAGAADALDSALEAVFRNHGEHPSQFVWACETMAEAAAPLGLRQRMTASLLEKIPDILTRKEFANHRARGKALLEGGQIAVRLILEKTTPQQAERFVSRIQRIDLVEPQRVAFLEQALVQAGGTERAGTEETLGLVATRAAVEAKRAELKQLLEVEIPKTLKGINAAAAEGDLRENFEYHMLRDRQELLSARAATLQRDLGRVRLLEPGSADTKRVNIGTVVHFADLAGASSGPITILGPWDAAVERRIFADGTELAQSLLGRSVGDEVAIEGEALRITRIEAWTGEGNSE